MKDYNTNTCWFCKKPFIKSDINPLSKSKLEYNNIDYDSLCYDGYFIDSCYHHDHAIIFKRKGMNNCKFTLELENYKEKYFWDSTDLTTVEHTSYGKSKYDKGNKRNHLANWKVTKFIYHFDRLISLPFTDVINELHTIQLFY